MVLTGWCQLVWCAPSFAKVIQKSACRFNTHISSVKPKQHKLCLDVYAIELLQLCTRLNSCMQSCLNFFPQFYVNCHPLCFLETIVFRHKFAFFMIDFVFSAGSPGPCSWPNTDAQRCLQLKCFVLYLLYYCVSQYNFWRGKYHMYT